MDGVHLAPRKDPALAASEAAGGRLRVALVGAGLVGQAGHAISLAEDRDRFELVAVVDASAAVRAAVAERAGAPHTAASLAEALPLGLDAVVVAVPDPAHRDTCVEALRAGLHVFCEKPLATSVEEADDIIAARGDRVLQCGYMKLHDPAVERLIELLPDDPAQLAYLSIEVNDPDQAPFVDHLGLVAGRDVPADLIDSTRRRGAAAVDRALGRPASVEETRAFEAYLSALVHDVSLAHHLLAALGAGPPLPLTDAAYFDGGRGVSLAWRLPWGGRAHLTHLNLPGVTDYTERVTLYCADRVLELTFPSPYLRHHPTRLVEKRSAPGVSASALDTVDHRVSYEEAFRNELRAFHASITRGEPVRASAEAAREDLRALLSAFRLASGAGADGAEVDGVVADDDGADGAGTDDAGPATA
jgi:predicted dehydrogenase